MIFRIINKDNKVYNFNRLFANSLQRSNIIGYWLLVIGHWSLVIGHWSLTEPGVAERFKTIRIFPLILLHRPFYI